MVVVYSAMSDHRSMSDHRKQGAEQEKENIENTRHRALDWLTMRVELAIFLELFVARATAPGLGGIWRYCAAYVLGAFRTTATANHGPLHYTMEAAPAMTDQRVYFISISERGREIRHTTPHHTTPHSVQSCIEKLLAPPAPVNLRSL